VLLAVVQFMGCVCCYVISQTCVRVLHDSCCIYYQVPPGAATENPASQDQEKVCYHFAVFLHF